MTIHVQHGNFSRVAEALNEGNRYKVTPEALTEIMRSLGLEFIDSERLTKLEAIEQEQRELDADLAGTLEVDAIAAHRARIKTGDGSSASALDDGYSRAAAGFVREEPMMALRTGFPKPPDAEEDDGVDWSEPEMG